MTFHRDKRHLYEIIKPLREAKGTWAQIGKAIGLSGERCRQVWQLFVVDQKSHFVVESGQEGAPNGNVSATELAAPDSAPGNRG